MALRLCRQDRLGPVRSQASERASVLASKCCIKPEQQVNGTMFGFLSNDLAGRIPS
jgi:hypothetical protein